MRFVLKSKLEHAKVTTSNVEYEGSIGLSYDLLEAAEITPYEQVHVLNVDTGARVITYAIMERDPGIVAIYGAAAHHFDKGDRVIILSYELMDDIGAATTRPRLVRVDDHNRA